MRSLAKEFDAKLVSFTRTGIGPGRDLNRAQAVVGRPLLTLGEQFYRPHQERAATDLLVQLVGGAESRAAACRGDDDGYVHVKDRSDRRTKESNVNPGRMPGIPRGEPRGCSPEGLSRAGTDAKRLTEQTPGG